MKNKRIAMIVGGIALLALVVSVLLATSSFLNTDFDSDRFGLSQMGARAEAKEYWEVEINQTMSNRNIEELGGPDKQMEMLTEQIKGSLSRANSEQVEFSVKEGEKTEAGILFTTLFHGRDPRIIGPVFYDDLGQVFNLLAGPISLKMSGETKVGTPLNLNLLTNSSTGYGWYMMEKSETVSQKGEKFWSDWDVFPGTPEIQSLNYIFEVSGNVEFNIDYIRPWESPNSWQSTSIIIVQRDFINIFDLIPNDPNFGDIGPNVVAEYESEHKWDEGISHPETFNWTTTDNHLNQALDLVVGDQGGCGSCWAFATTGITEAALQVQNGSGSYDLSEQYLVACNTYRKLCNGWNAYWALQYYIDKDAQNNNPPGAVVESDMPYNEFNFVCTTVQNHPLKIASRHHVIDNYTDGDSLAHVFDIKSALRIHGPIAVGVCGSGAFQLYSGGVFNANNCQNPNHQVLLVGWDDKTESWILKNSWGTDWGENGYMRIKWGTNRVGFEPIYVVAP